MIKQAVTRPETVVNADSHSPEFIGDFRREILSGDIRCCFIEREHLLDQFDQQADRFPGERRYAAAFGYVLEGLSTPVDSRELLVGTMLEGLPASADELPEKINWHDYINWNLLGGPGHMTADHETALRIGLKGLVQQAEHAADLAGTGQTRLFAQNARTCAEAVRDFAERWSEAAGKAGNHRAAEALRRVPYEPATTFFEGLQACWLNHLILSCCVGGRDYGFGRMDQYLIPLYRADIKNGRIMEQEAVLLLADFFLKTNRIAGVGCWNNVQKPVPSQSSKQYIVLGGTTFQGINQANELSPLFLEAANLVRLPQPILTVRFSPHRSPEGQVLHRKAFEVAPHLQGQLQFANDKFIPPSLIRKGVPGEVAHDYGASACSYIDLGPRHNRRLGLRPPVAWLLELLGWCGGDQWERAPAFSSFEDLLDAYRRLAEQKLRKVVQESLATVEPNYECGFTNGGAFHFHFESLFVRGCAGQALNTCEGGPEQDFRAVGFVGIATLIDSLLAIKKQVFDDRILSLEDLKTTLAHDFGDPPEPEINQALTKLPRFGNDLKESNELARKVGNLLLDSLEEASKDTPAVFYGIFYSLNTHLGMGKRLPATPDGRRTGEPLSENQSPVPGADHKGMTALLNSVASLPFERACSGSLNLKFTRPVLPEKLEALIGAFFAEGGAIVGISTVSRETLEDAMAHPENHQTLYVRVFGFSEFFTQLPEAEQLEMVRKTEYAL